MAYDRDDRGGRGYGRGDYGRGREYGRNYDRFADDDNDRGFFERAGDEVRSWFGDEEAERRRRLDERYDDRWEGGQGRSEPQRNYGGFSSGYDRSRQSQADYGRGGTDRGGRDYDRSGAGRTYAGAQGGDYGRSNIRETGRTGGGGYGWNSDRSQSQHGHHDESYRSWRDRQMESFDRDYEDYRRENQSKFESEFGTYRQTREQQRGWLGSVREHQEVVGSDGQHVGTVDHVQGDRIKLTKQDKDAQGHHHTIPSSWIRTVGDKVEISKTADEAKRHWREVSDEGSRSAFGQGGSRSEASSEATASSGNLNRSFSGTY